MTDETANDTPPLDSFAVDHAEALADEAIDLNLAVRELLDCDLESMPTAAKLLTQEIDKRLVEIVEVLRGRAGDKPPLKAVEE